MRLGHKIFTERFQILWGNRDASVDNLKTAYPSLNLVKLKQTHSDIVRAHTARHNAHGEEGDALISNVPGSLLAISTADCLPIVVIQEKTGWVSGIHAGWRGVANGITVKAIKSLVLASGSDEGLRVWIGPHIQMSSFEVGTDVQEQIFSSIPGASRSGLSKDLGDGKHLMNLSMIVKIQLDQAGIAPYSFWVSNQDTMTTNSYHSHRRDREKSGRQHSAIIL